MSMLRLRLGLSLTNLWVDEHAIDKAYIKHRLEGELIDKVNREVTIYCKRHIPTWKYNGIQPNKVCIRLKNDTYKPLVLCDKKDLLHNTKV